MTQDEIIEIAKQTGDATKDARGRESFCFDSYGIEAFANLVAQLERERIATSIERLPFGDTAQSFVAFVRGMKK